MATNTNNPSRRTVLGALAVAPAIVALPAAASTGASAEVEAVTALAAEWRRLRAAFVAFHDGEFLATPTDNPNHPALYEQQEAMDREQFYKLAEVETYPVTTFEGLVAKLDVILEAYGNEALDGFGLTDPLIADVLRVAGRA